MEKSFSRLLNCGFALCQCECLCVSLCALSAVLKAVIWRQSRMLYSIRQGAVALPC